MVFPLLPTSLLTLAAVTPQGDDVLRVGVSAIRGDAATQELWSGLEGCLERGLDGRDVEIVPLDLDSVLETAALGRVDLLIHQPVIKAQVTHVTGGRTLLSLQRPGVDGWTSQMGTTFVVRAEDERFRTPESLRGARVAAVSPLSYGGWLIARRELKLRGIEPDDFASLEFTGFPQDGVLERVLAGTADVGIVRTGLLESMVAEGSLAPGSLRVLALDGAEHGSGESSTRLYPEWGMLALPSVDEDLGNRIAMLLLSAGAESGPFRWSLPRDLGPVRELMRALELAPYAPAEPPSLTSQILHHRATPWIGALLVVCAAMALLRRSHARAEAATMAARLKDAEDLARAKADFLANMSHEIRTPMTAILGFAEMLTEPPAPLPSAGEPGLDRSEAARTIQSSGAHLLAILDDVLDMSKLEAGRIEMERVPVDLAELVRGSVELMGERAKGSELKIVQRVDEGTPGRVLGDPTRLRQVVINLLSNAVKFTHRGRIEVRVRVIEGERPLRIEVRDTGVGMGAEQLERIRRFEPFTQADASTTRMFGGTGLGLAISARLVEAMGGLLEVESILGAGTTFSICLPLALATEQAVDVAPAPGAAEPSLDGVRVLLVEDGRDNQRLISLMLRRSGAVVEICEHGGLALERLVGSSDAPLPDLVLMDMQMPVLDGYSATSELRARGIELPIIALTAHAAPSDRERCLDAGCDDFLTKPVPRADLVAACARHVAERAAGAV